MTLLQPTPPRYHALINCDGEPVAQPRVKSFANVVGGRAITRMYTPGKADGWKRRVWAACREKAPPAPIDAPFGVILELWFERPKGLLKPSSPRSPLWCAVKPDIDNAEKAVLDAVSEAGIWTDDSRIAWLFTLKRYLGIDSGGAYVGLPGARIRIIQLEGGAAVDVDRLFRESHESAMTHVGGVASWLERRTQ